MLWEHKSEPEPLTPLQVMRYMVLWALKNGREAGWLGGEVGPWKELLLRGLLPEDRGAEVEEAVMNWFEREVDRGRKDGERRGRREGERDGERNAERRVLLKQLRLRFGELPAAVLARVEAAEVPELDVWTERVMTASRLEDVLGPTPV